MGEIRGETEDRLPKADVGFNGAPSTDWDAWQGPSQSADGKLFVDADVLPRLTIAGSSGRLAGEGLAALLKDVGGAGKGAPDAAPSVARAADSIFLINVGDTPKAPADGEKDTAATPAPETATARLAREALELRAGIWQDRFTKEGLADYLDQDQPKTWRQDYNAQTVAALEKVMGANGSLDAIMGQNGWSDRPDKNDTSESGRNAFYLRQYLRAGDDKGRQEALRGLEAEVTSGDNYYALGILKTLALSEAARKLEAAKTEPEKLAALKELVGLNLGDAAKEKRDSLLTGFPDGNAQERAAEAKLSPAERELAVSGRRALLEQAQKQSSETTMGIGVGRDLSVLKVATGDAAGRAEGLKDLEQSTLAATKSASPEQAGELSRELQKARVSAVAADLLEAKDAKAASEALQKMVLLAGKDNNPYANAFIKNNLGAVDGLLSDLGSSDPAVVQKALVSLKDTLKPEQADRERLSRMSPEAILQAFSERSPESVAKARKEMAEFSAANLERADAHLAKYLDRKSTPEERKQALAGLEVEAQSRLRALRSDNFTNLVGRLKSDDVNLDDLRVGRIVRALDGKSSPEAYERAAKELKQEAETEGNKGAADWLKWAKSSQLLATMQEAKSAGDVIKSVKDLGELARDGNQYARRALAAVLLTGESKERQLDWYRHGNSTVDGKATFIPALKNAAALNDVVMHQAKLDAIASLDATTGGATGAQLTKGEAGAVALAVTAAIEQAQSSKDLAGDGSSDKAGKPVLSDDAGKRSKELAASAEKLLTRTIAEVVPGDNKSAAVPSPGSHAAIDGLSEVLASDVKGRRSLVDTYLTGAKHPEFARNFTNFQTKSLTGDQSSLAILAATSAGITDRRELTDRSVRALELAAISPAARKTAESEMLAAFARHGDKGALLDTLGGMAAMDKAVSPEIRAALHRGVASTSPETHRSAVAGLMKTAEFWVSADAELVKKNLTPEMIKGLAEVADRIPSALRQDIIGDAMKMANSSSKIEDRIAALQTLGALGKYVSADNVVKLAQMGTADGQNITNLQFKNATGLPGLKNQGFSDEQAKQIQTEAGRTILQQMGKAENTQAKEAAFQAFGLLKWDGVGNDEVRRAVVDFARGKGDIPLALLDQVNALVYDAGIPMPGAGVLRQMNPGFADKQYFDRVSDVSKHYGTDTKSGDTFIREVAVRTTLWNSLDKGQREEIMKGLSPELKRYLTGPAGDIDPAQVAGVMANGKLREKFPFLMPDGFGKKSLEQVVKEREQGADAALAAGVAESQKLKSQHSAAIRDLCEMTKKGPGFSSYAGNVLSLGGLVGDNPLDKWEGEQGEKVKAIRGLDAKIAANQNEIAGTSQLRDLMHFASTIADYQDNLNAGKRKQADLSAVIMLRDYGPDMMRAYAPQAYKSLTERSGGEGNFGRSGLERLKDNKLASVTYFPTYSNDPLTRATQGLTFLKGWKPQGSGADVEAYRRTALRAVDADPALNTFGDAGRVMSKHMPAMMEMFQAGQEGKKYQEFVSDVKSRAAEIKTALDKITPDQVKACKESVAKLEKALPDIEDPQAKRSVQEKITAMNKMLESLDPQSENRKKLDQMLSMIGSRDFNADTFGNWLRENAVVIGVTLAAAALTVATMGAASPLAVILVTSAVCVGSSELTKEALYLSNHYIGDSGLGKFNERSHAGKWSAATYDTAAKFIASANQRSTSDNAAELSKNVQDVAKSLGTDVLLPMGKEFLFNAALGFVCFGMGQVGAEGLKKASLGTMKNVLLTKPGANMAAQMEAASAATAGNPAGAKFFGDVMGRFRQEMATNVKFTASLEGGQHLTEAAAHDLVGKGNRWVTLGLSGALAFRQGRVHRANDLRVGEGKEIIAHPEVEAAVIEQYKTDGHSVKEVGPGVHEVTPYNAAPGDAPVVLRRDGADAKSAVSDAKPATGEVKPATADAKPAAGDAKPAPVAEARVTLLPKNGDTQVVLKDGEPSRVYKGDSEVEIIRDGNNHTLNFKFNGEFDGAMTSADGGKTWSVTNCEGRKGQWQGEVRIGAKESTFEFRGKDNNNRPFPERFVDPTVTRAEVDAANNAQLLGGEPKTAAEVAVVKQSINDHGSSPRKMATQAMEGGRVVAFGERHTGAEAHNPMRTLGVELIGGAKKGGATHLAVEMPESIQPVLTKFNKGELSVAELKAELSKMGEGTGNHAGNYTSPDYLNLLKAARDNGLTIVAVDHAHITGQTGQVVGKTRDAHIASKVGEILKQDPANKVVMWYGSSHLGPTESRSAPTAVSLLRGNNYKVVTVVGEASACNGGPLSHMTGGLQQPVAVPTKAAGIGEQRDIGGAKLGRFSHVIVFPDAPAVPTVKPGVGSLADPSVTTAKAAAESPVKIGPSAKPAGERNGDGPPPPKPEPSRAVPAIGKPEKQESAEEILKALRDLLDAMAPKP